MRKNGLKITKAKRKKTRNKRMTFKEDSTPQYKWCSENCKQTCFDMTPLCYDTTDCWHSPYIPRVVWYAGWIKLLFVDIRTCAHCELIWWISPYTCPTKSKFNLGNITTWYMVILVLPFLSGALYNFCYNATCVLMYSVFIKNISFGKEACMVSHKDQDFTYF